MARPSELNFIRQQGFRDIGAEACEFKFPALMFQPKVVGILVLTGVLLQSAPLFICLSVVLIWGALLPTRNVFDALYNSVIARPRGFPLLTPAPAPRRFAQGVAATFMLVIAVCLYSGWHVAAWIVEGLLVMALSALIFGRFCLGSYLYHLVSGNAEYAHRTLPWSRGGK